MRRRAAMIVALAVTLSVLGVPASASHEVCIVRIPGFGCVERVVCKTFNQVSPHKIYCLR